RRCARSRGARLAPNNAARRGHRAHVGAGFPMKKVIRWGFLAVAVGLLAWAVMKEWDDVAEALRSLSWPTIIVAGLAATLALGINGLSWREVMVSVGLEASVPSALRVF